MDLGLGRWIYMVLRQHSRIELSLLKHQSTSEEKHGRLLKRGSGDCRTFLCNVTQALKAPEERQGRQQDQCQ